MKISSYICRPKKETRGRGYEGTRGRGDEGTKFLKKMSRDWEAGNRLPITEYRIPVLSRDVNPGFKTGNKKGSSLKEMKHKRAR